MKLSSESDILPSPVKLRSTLVLLFNVANASFPIALVILISKALALDAIPESSKARLAADVLRANEISPVFKPALFLAKMAFILFTCNSVVRAAPVYSIFTSGSSATIVSNSLVVAGVALLSTRSAKFVVVIP